MVGIKLEVEGEEKLKGWGGKSAKGPCVFVINHQSEIDVLIASRVRSVHCLFGKFYGIDVRAAFATSYSLVRCMGSQQSALFWAVHEIVSNCLCGSTQRFGSYQQEDHLGCCRDVASCRNEFGHVSRKTSSSSLNDWTSRVNPYFRKEFEATQRKQSCCPSSVER